MLTAGGQYETDFGRQVREARTQQPARLEAGQAWAFCTEGFRIRCELAAFGDVSAGRYGKPWAELDARTRMRLGAEARKLVQALL